MNLHEFLKSKSLDKDRIPLLYEQLYNACEGWRVQTKLNEKKLQELNLLLSGNVHKLIIPIVCLYFDIDENRIESKYRGRDYVNARAIIAYILRQRFRSSYTLKRIGQIFGNRDHATIVNYIKNSNDWLQTDDEFLRTYNIISKILNGKLIELQNKQLDAVHQ